MKKKKIPEDIEKLLNNVKEQKKPKKLDELSPHDFPLSFDVLPGILNAGSSLLDFFKKDQEEIKMLKEIVENNTFGMTKKELDIVKKHAKELLLKIIK